MTCAVELTLRPMRETDENLVIDSWYRSYFKSRDGRSYPQVEQFYEDYQPIVRALVERSTVYVAALKAEDDAVAGWAALEGGVLHYVFVKRRWRELGVARWLMTRLGLTDGPVVHTHQTNMCRFAWENSLAPEVTIPGDWPYRRFKIWQATPAKEKAA